LLKYELFSCQPHDTLSIDDIFVGGAGEFQIGSEPHRDCLIPHQTIKTSGKAGGFGI
jgi:hypothetical protein